MAGRQFILQKFLDNFKKNSDRMEKMQVDCLKNDSSSPLSRNFSTLKMPGIFREISRERLHSVCSPGSPADFLGHQRCSTVGWSASRTQISEFFCVARSKRNHTYYLEVCGCVGVAATISLDHRHLVIRPVLRRCLRDNSQYRKSISLMAGVRCTWERHYSAQICK